MKKIDKLLYKVVGKYPRLKIASQVIGLLFLVQGCATAPENEINSDLEGFELQKVVTVGPSGFSSSFSYYNTTPESPDGSLIAYVKYLNVPEGKRYDPVSAELWVCGADLSNHRKVVDINMNGLHNGGRQQWLDKSSFVYQDDSIRVVNVDGKALIKPVAGTVGHNPHDGKFLYAAVDEETGLYTIYEYNVAQQAIEKLGDASDYVKIEELYPDDVSRPVEDRKILHLQYSPDGSKIAFRIDIGSSDEKYKHLVTQKLDGSDVRYFGPKPMHFAWYDNESLMGHDNQIDDGMPDDKSGRRWDLEGNFIETLSGVGNHLGASFDRQLFASESWYRQDPIILKVFEKGSINPIWQDTVSTDPNITWTLGNHVNPSFSRYNKRLYFNKLTDEGMVQACMAVLKE